MLLRILRLGLLTSIMLGLVGCPQRQHGPPEDTEIHLTPAEAEQAVDVLVAVEPIQYLLETLNLLKWQLIGKPQNLVIRLVVMRFKD